MLTVIYTCWLCADRLVLFWMGLQDDDDDGEGDKEERPRWYKRPLVWWRIAALCISGLLLLVGVLSQNVNAISKVNNAGVDLFRWVGCGWWALGCPKGGSCCKAGAGMYMACTW